MTNPEPMGSGPGRRAAPGSTVSQEELGELLPRDALGDHCVFARPLKITHGFVLSGWHAHFDQVARAQEVGQLHRISTVRLNSTPLLHGHERGRHDYATD